MWSKAITLGQWVSAFQMLSAFKTVAHVVMTPSHKIILLLSHNCDFATIMNHNADI